MGIDSLNIQNKALIQAAMLKKQSGSATVANNNNPTALAMSKNGSIFNLINSTRENSRTNPKNDLANQNVFRSLDDLNNRKPSAAKNDDSSNPGNASEGRAQAREMEAQANDLKSSTSSVQNDARTVTNFTANSQKLDKQIKNNEKKYSSQIRTQQAELKRDNQRIAKLAKEQEETQREIDNAQHELDSLMASSSFSINRGSDGASSDPNQARIAELQEYIGAKVSGMQANGKAIYSLQRSSSKTLSRMNKTNAQFVKTQKTNTKSLEKQESTTEKIIKVATKVEQISSLVTQGGQALKMLGEIMMAAGTSGSLFTAWMIPVGTVMAKAGVVAEMAGNYGQAAANVTKTAAYAADGNIAGAMQSAAAAVQTGAAAAKSTKGLKDEFGKINDQAKAANTTREANIEAKKTVQEEREKATKVLAEENGINTKNLSSEEIEQRLKAKVKADKKNGRSTFGTSNGKNLSLNDAVNGRAFGTDANGNVINAKQARAAISADLQNRSAQGGDLNVKTRHNQYKQGKEIRGKMENAGSTSLENARKTGFTNTVANAAKSSTSLTDRMKKFYNGFQMTAAAFGQNSNTNGYDNNYMTAPTGRKSSVAKFNEWNRTHGTHRIRSSRRARIA